MFLLMTTYSERLLWLDFVQECDCVQMCIDPWEHIIISSLQLLWCLYYRSAAAAALNIPSCATLKALLSNMNLLEVVIWQIYLMTHFQEQFRF